MAEANADIQNAPDTLTASATTVTPQEMDASFVHPAPICNRVLLTMSSLGGRLSFLELSPNGEAHFRSAVFMTLDGLLSLQELIRTMVPQPLVDHASEENKDAPLR
ncbi:hypothetical protein [Hyphomicrobium sp.]|jgi:hypothetical protein|uniref:hypothetical protein n=1 Tax=Hyphomicrobium sp. TaxID=82 RepID=UPI003563BF09